MLAAWRDGSEWWIDGSVTLIGAKTTVRHNCTDEDRATCGWLGVYSFVSSTIHLVSLLTDDIVSMDDGGGGDWGAEDGGDIVL